LVLVSGQPGGTSSGRRLLHESDFLQSLGRSLEALARSSSYADRSHVAPGQKGPPSSRPLPFPVADLRAVVADPVVAEDHPGPAHRPVHDHVSGHFTSTVAAHDDIADGGVVASDLFTDAGLAFLVHLIPAEARKTGDVKPENRLRNGEGGGRCERRIRVTAVLDPDASAPRLARWAPLREPDFLAARAQPELGGDGWDLPDELQPLPRGDGGHRWPSHRPRATAAGQEPADGAHGVEPTPDEARDCSFDPPMDEITLVVRGCSHKNFALSANAFLDSGAMPKCTGCTSSG